MFFACKTQRKIHLKYVLNWDSLRSKNPVKQERNRYKEFEEFKFKIASNEFNLNMRKLTNHWCSCFWMEWRGEVKSV